MQGARPHKPKLCCMQWRNLVCGLLELWDLETHASSPFLPFLQLLMAWSQEEARWAPGSRGGHGSVSRDQSWAVQTVGLRPGHLVGPEDPEKMAAHSPSEAYCCPRSPCPRGGQWGPGWVISVTPATGERAEGDGRVGARSWPGLGATSELLLLSAEDFSELAQLLAGGL